MKAPCGACATCEQCPYDDCTWDGVSAAEWAAAKDTDADARHAVESKQAAQQRAWYEANREKAAAQQRAYREANREKVEEYNRRYYQKRKKAKNDAARNPQQV